MSDTPLLSSVKFAVFGRVAMPVIAIKLDNSIFRWDKSINGELVVNDVLRSKLNADFSQNRVSKLLKFVWLGFRLVGVHFQQSCIKFRICISAFHRAIFAVIKNYSGRGNFKGAATNLANKANFVSALPSIAALYATSKRFIKVASRNVKANTALFAVNIFAVLNFVGGLIGVVARRAAKLNSFKTAFSYGNATSNTKERSNFIFHSSIIQQMTPTHNPIKLYKWLINAGIKRVEQSQKQERLFA